MTRFTGKGKHIVKVGSNPHTHLLPKPATIEEEEQMQDTGNAFAIKRPPN